MKRTSIATHPSDEDHPVHLEEDYQQAARGPDHLRHTEFPTSRQTERKTKPIVLYRRGDREFQKTSIGRKTTWEPHQRFH
ncbi:hypothetical protein TNIN_262231 [Trichonephila inaurata madagascariensis]|uniref:Uncharacterized protein n=1 Tax=Trichonephila inaurata madagascariensis TaxID=2747483 RepID=A0A8X7BWR2_9ARAC|nr:hypothetical protein TNIN_262231 [Trichonephila inaurata madagascariensis]